MTRGVLRRRRFKPRYHLSAAAVLPRSLQAAATGLAGLAGLLDRGSDFAADAFFGLPTGTFFLGAITLLFGLCP